MSLTVTNQTGDGVLDDLFNVVVTLPDTGTAVQLDGYVQPVGGPSMNITGGPLTIPAAPAPASGSVFYNIQVDSVAGAASVQQSTTADPALVTGTSRVVFRQTLTPSVTDPALGAESTPDNN